ncbi:aldehyde dehydrogenase family protein [Mongoliitalea lutea]|uniref:NAD-dependent succinate-semialdehyde dehydrogenase n=1 Tax=Mongoliitalea lutea TaxID=849756 RepID=A0A8J3CWR9_9BACT|nr:aldehyde dehydrogenase family protein [Mongoliitalea lutea]GHB34593.1 NAD-dependent succinate-semialdehyde dehydrogenase [Mongoliitalea lutea]
MKNYINGEWIAFSQEEMDVLNPVDGSLLDSVCRSGLEDVNAAVNAATKAFETWKKTPMQERVQLQKKLAASMRKHSASIGRQLSLELGRPLTACIHEINRSAELLEYYAEEALRMKGYFPLTNVEGEKVLVTREPLGVVVSITPFNYPITLLTFKMGAALVMGCTMVSKPSEDTPLSTLALAACFEEAGYPAGVFNVITGYGREIGDALVSHPKVAKIAFTGGTSTGAHIAGVAARTHKRITLELGGQSPAILCEDADLDTAVPAIVKHGFANTGQFCYRVNRVYVHESLYEQFCKKMKEATEKLTLGAGIEDTCDLGPMVNEKIFANAFQQIEDAQSKGARILTGGKRRTGGIFEKGFFLEPTLIAESSSEMKIMREETFGPVIGLASFTDETAAIQEANASQYGLAAYVFSHNIGRGLRIAEQLQAGSVWVNNIQRSYHSVPFGGMKQSGIGREKGIHGLEAYTELKTIYLNY